MAMMTARFLHDDDAARLEYGMEVSRLEWKSWPCHHAGQKKKRGQQDPIEC